MLWNYSYYICKGTLWITLVIVACTTYAYTVNARRPADDPKRKDYSPYAILAAPITVPFLITCAILIFIIRALLFAIFLFVFTIALIAIRKPFVFVWLDRIATNIGEPLLEINTNVIRLAFTPWSKSPKPI
jgi:cbb3-type cytochrome oxidase subunit 3